MVDVTAAEPPSLPGSHQAEQEAISVLQNSISVPSLVYGPLTSFVWADIEISVVIIHQAIKKQNKTNKPTR